MRHIKINLLIIFSFLLLSVNSQTIQNYSELDGLSSNYVECVAVDIYDNVWFGTADGVSMYDGNSWTTFNQSSYPNLLSNNIKAIAAMSMEQIN